MYSWPLRRPPRECAGLLREDRGDLHSLSVVAPAAASPTRCRIAGLSGSSAGAAAPRPARCTAAAGRRNRLSAGRITGARSGVEGRWPEPVQHPLVIFSSVSKHLLITRSDKKLDGFVTSETAL